MLKRRRSVILLISLAIFFHLAAGNRARAAERLFYAELNADNINVRGDSTVSSEVICTLGRGEVVEVVKESYGWYKIRLPKGSSVWAKKDFFSKISDKSAKATGADINLRVSPSLDSRIIGSVNQDEIVEVLEDSGEWLRIGAVNNSFGWVNKQFLNKAPATIVLKREKPGPLPQNVPVIPIEEPLVSQDIAGSTVTIEGIIKPYGRIFGRKGTHKLIASDDSVFLLKGNTANLNSLTYHKVRITGNTAGLGKNKLPLIEVVKAQVLD